MLCLSAMILFNCENSIRDHRINIEIETGELQLSGFIYLKELNVHGMRLVDSAEISGKKRVSFRLKTDSSGFYLVGNSPRNFVSLQIEPGESISLKINSEDFSSNYELKGSKGSAILKDFNDRQKKNRSRVDSLGYAFDAAKQSGNLAIVKPKLDSVYKNIFQDQYRFTKELILNNPGSLSVVYLVNQSFGQGLIFSEDENLDLFILVDSAVSKKYPGNKHAIDHHKRVEEAKQRRLIQQSHSKRTAIGEQAPQLVLKDLISKEYSLKKELDKVTILYFWQSMCAQCRKENMMLTGFFNKLKHRGVNLWMISLDDDPEMTRAAVKIDNPSGTVFNAPGGLNSVVARDYNITTKLPVYYVIGRDGKIAVKGNSLDEVKDHIMILLPKNILIEKTENH
jgi:peroxiredoxin